MPSMKIMIVDDSAAICLLLKKDLEDKGFKVRTYPEPVQAMSEIEAFQPDVLITDFEMPEMDGIELAKQAKRKIPKIPVILISGRKLNQIGMANAYLEKPFLTDDLIHQIHRLV